MLSARRRIASRLLPFLCLLYLINFIDRVNISFAALRMRVDLGFSDSVYGLGASVFFLTYVLFEIPGAILVERWSARKWIARIMITWGLVTIFTAFIHTAAQFYTARLLLGAAEASFYPGVMIYLTRWFTLQDRGKAIAAFYAAVPAGNFLGSAIASVVLGVHWLGMPGWRWLFVVEGVPAVLIGFVTLVYLDDHPSQARWLPAAERDWIVDALAVERAAKERLRRFTFRDACTDPRMLCMLFGYFFYQIAVVTNSFWMPTFLQRISSLPMATVARVAMLPPLAGLAGLLLNSWHSDRTGERKWHAIIPAALAGLCYLLIIPAGHHLQLVVLLFAVYFFFSLAYVPSYWAMPTMLLAGTTAAAAFGLITSVSQIGSFIGPYVVGYLNDRTHSIYPSIGFIGCSLFVAAAILSLTEMKAVQAATRASAAERRAYTPISDSVDPMGDR